MQPLYRAPIATKFGPKAIEVYACDIREFDEAIDILATSAFKNSYFPTPGTIYHALDSIGISVRKLSRAPMIELNAPSRIWLSEEIKKSERIRRVCCIDLTGAHALSGACVDAEQVLLHSICAFFSILDVASVYGVKMDTIALPLLGSGNQNLSGKLTIVPLLNECISFLNRNSEVKRICFVDKEDIKADMIADHVKKSYHVTKQDIRQGVAKQALIEKNSLEDSPKRAFISYSSLDKNVADNLCFKLESSGIPVWYAPRDVSGPYAESIIHGIDHCSHFIVILSQNSLLSEHVLNEIDIAFQRLPNGIKFKPLRIDESDFPASFKYYLSRQHWMDANVPPLEDRLNEFVKKVLEDL